MGKGAALKSAIKFITEYGKALAFLATIVAFLIGAVAEELVLVFWLVCAAALIFIVIKKLFRVMERTVFRYRKFLPTVRRAVTAENRETKLSREVAILKFKLPEEYNRGLAAGASRVVGAQLGQGLVTLPQLSSLTLIQGTVGFASRYDAESVPIVGSWFSVEVIDTGDIKGAVKVVEIRDKDSVAMLQLCEEDVPEFWERLRLRVNANPDPPGSVRLSVYSLPEASTPSIHSNSQEGK